jgi:hypothetical protein
MKHEIAGLNGVAQADFWLSGKCKSNRLCVLLPDMRQQNIGTIKKIRDHPSYQLPW